MHFGAGRQRLTVAHLTTRSVAACATQKQPVRHHVVQRAVENAAVRLAVEAAVVVARSELAAAEFAVETEADPQADGIVGAANETAWRVGSRHYDSPAGGAYIVSCS